MAELTKISLFTAGICNLYLFFFLLLFTFSVCFGFILLFSSGESLDNWFDFFFFNIARGHLCSPERHREGHTERKWEREGKKRKYPLVGHGHTEIPFLYLPPAWIWGMLTHVPRVFLKQPGPGFEPYHQPLGSGFPSHHRSGDWLFSSFLLYPFTSMNMSLAFL